MTANDITDVVEELNREKCEGERHERGEGERGKGIINMIEKERKWGAGKYREEKKMYVHV